ncbi:MAG: hypothetical protein IJD67_00340, partial [Clostridia bacterium]|nr:hypothetical protein [Clostridia bacterium]
INISIITCPKTPHVENVGNVTSPVTQVDVVAVKRASIYGTEFPSAELIGRVNRMLPSDITKIKLNNII